MNKATKPALTNYRFDMPRTYQPVAANKRRKYTAEALEAAVQDVRNGKRTISGAAKRYGIPRRAFGDKMSVKHPRKTGGQPIFSTVEESTIAKTIQAVAE